MDITIRNVDSADRAQWAALYQAYADFYGVTQTAQMRDTVWAWLMDADHAMNGLVAADPQGKLIGLAHFRAFARPLSATIGGFLDDLFVCPEGRGSGAAEALIAGIKDAGRAKGWSVIRWITAEDNYRARALYDRVSEKTKWTTYDIKL